MSRWTNTEDRVLRSLLRERFAAQVIADILGRTRAAIWTRRYAQGIETFDEARNNTLAARRIVAEAVKAEKAGKRRVA